MDVQRKVYVGVVEDNKDPNKKGRIKVRIQTIFNDITVEDIPYASPFMGLAGKRYEIPAIGKIVNILFLTDDIYDPYYIFSEYYNINLQNKLKSLSDTEYVDFVALLFDDRTQIYADNNELTIDHFFNKMTINKWQINMELKDNKGLLNLGSRDASQEAVLGTRWFEWMDKFVDELAKPSSLIGNLGAPILKPKINALIAEYKVLRKDFVSNNVKIVDNRKVSMLERDADTTKNDIYQIIPQNEMTESETKNQQELERKIREQNKNGCKNISESVPTDSIPEIEESTDNNIVFVVKRYLFLSDRTIGKLYINDQYFCDTLEDKVRDLKKEKKVFGETAIPFGKYGLTVGPTGLSKQTAPTGRLPLVNDVPYFSGIRIHKWGKPKDTEGCLLVGNLQTSDNTLINHDKIASKVLEICENYQKKNKKMTIFYVKEDDPDKLVDTKNQLNQFQGSDYTKKDDQNSFNQDSDTPSCNQTKTDPSWSTQLETQDYGPGLEYTRDNLLVTEDQLKQIMPQASTANIKKFLMPINITLDKFNINTPLLISAFLSQVAAESGNLIYVKELGGQSYFNKYEPNTTIGKSLGNTEVGDGYKFKGRGLIQVTGRANYTQVGQVLGKDFINNPELLEDSLYAALASGVWWNKRSAQLTQKANSKDIKGITKIVNGGYNGLAERTAAYNRALNTFNVA